MVAHIRAVMDIGDTKKNDAVFKAQVEARLGPEEAAKVIAEAGRRNQPMKTYMYESFIRFHVSIMHMNRRLWKDYCKDMDCDPSQIRIHHVGFDASPLRGREVFGGIYYTVTGNDLSTRQLHMCWTLFFVH